MVKALNLTRLWRYLVDSCRTAWPTRMRLVWRESWSLCWTLCLRVQTSWLPSLLLWLLPLSPMTTLPTKTLPGHCSTATALLLISFDCMTQSTGRTALLLLLSSTATLLIRMMSSHLPARCPNLHLVPWHHTKRRTQCCALLQDQQQHCQSGCSGDYCGADALEIWLLHGTSTLHAMSPPHCFNVLAQVVMYHGHAFSDVGEAAL